MWKCKHCRNKPLKAVHRIAGKLLLCEQKEFVFALGSFSSLAFSQHRLAVQKHHRLCLHFFIGAFRSTTKYICCWLISYFKECPLKKLLVYFCNACAFQSNFSNQYYHFLGFVQAQSRLLQKSELCRIFVGIDLRENVAVTKYLFFILGLIPL